MWECGNVAATDVLALFMQGDIVYKQFVIPLLQQLDTYKVNMEASEAQYERSMREMSQKIKETEAASMENGRKRQRGKGHSSRNLFVLFVVQENWMMICLFDCEIGIMTLFLAAVNTYFPAQREPTSPQWHGHSP
jgi:hypothetical protein